jgi:SAM-dependent methyltransferase
MTVDGGPALRRWQQVLAGWEIPAEIMAAAPEPPWGYPVELFRAAPDPTDGPSRDRAREALPADGSVLDVGCGGGAAGLALTPPAGFVVGVDESADMLTEFAAAAASRDVAHRTVVGRWPDAADEAATADVVVCHHVLYNVTDLAPFVRGLTAAARRRVVVELTATHPMTGTAPLWKHFHDLERPGGPTAELAVHVLEELGVQPRLEAWSRPARDVPRDVYVRLNRQRLCLPRSAEPEVDRVMGRVDGPREVATIWWDV